MKYLPPALEKPCSHFPFAHVSGWVFTMELRKESGCRWELPVQQGEGEIVLSTVWCLKQFWLCMQMEQVVVFSMSFFFLYWGGEGGGKSPIFDFIAKTLHLWG